MKKMICGMLSVLMTVSQMDSISVFHAETEQKCGKNAEWSFSGHTLTISGTGAMDDYSSETPPPWNTYNEQICEIAVMDGITAIGAFAFSSCSATDVSLPDSCVSVGDNAFAGMQQLNKLVLPSGLQSIGDSCFRDSYGLAEVSIPDTVTHIGSGIFEGDAAWHHSQTEDFVIAGDGILLKYFGTDTEITVPDTVRQISTNVFTTQMYLPMATETETYEIVFSPPRTDITEITLPDQMTELPAQAFAGLAGLQKIHLPENLQSISGGAFEQCAALNAVTIPDTVTKLDSRAFWGCSSLKEIILPASVTALGDSVFEGCMALANIQIPDTLLEIGCNAFSQTPWFQSHEGFLMIGNGLLYHWQGREKLIAIPETVRTICKNAFIDTDNRIMEIQIPASVTQIQPEAIVCSGAVIVSETGSAAENYARENNMQFRDIQSEQPRGADMTFDYTKDGWCFGNSREIFGDDYFLTDADRAKLEALGIDTRAVDKAWGGSCLGQAVTAILVKNGVFSTEMLQSDAKTLSEVQPTDEIRSFINYYHAIAAEDGVSRSHEPINQKIYRMIQIAKNVKSGESPFLLTYATPTAAHAVIGYGQEDGAWEFDGKAYDSRILVWDSNFPKALSDEACLYYDSKTFDYCIPYYGVHYADDADDNAGGIQMVCNDLNILNAYPYTFAEQQHDLNGDASVDVADAVLLARFVAEDATLTKAQTDEILNANTDADGDHLITILDAIVILKEVINI